MLDLTKRLCAEISKANAQMRAELLRKETKSIRSGTSQIESILGKANEIASLGENLGIRAVHGGTTSGASTKGIIKISTHSYSFFNLKPPDFWYWQMNLGANLR